MTKIIALVAVAFLLMSCAGPCTGPFPLTVNCL
jgi:hypothetical protein